MLLERDLSALFHLYFFDSRSRAVGSIFKIIMNHRIWGKCVCQVLDCGNTKKKSHGLSVRWTLNTMIMENKQKRTLFRRIPENNTYSWWNIVCTECKAIKRTKTTRQLSLLFSISGIIIFIFLLFLEIYFSFFFCSVLVSTSSDSRI